MKREDIPKRGYKGKKFDPEHDPKKYFAEKSVSAGVKPKNQRRAKTETITGPSNTQVMNNPSPQKNEPLLRMQFLRPKYMSEN